MKTFRYENFQVWKLSDMKTFRYENFQIWKLSDMKTFRNSDPRWVGPRRPPPTQLPEWAGGPPRPSAGTDFMNLHFCCKTIRGQIFILELWAKFHLNAKYFFVAKPSQNQLSHRGTVTRPDVAFYFMPGAEQRYKYQSWLLWHPFNLTKLFDSHAA
jgi:hypothetical protein